MRSGLEKAAAARPLRNRVAETMTSFDRIPRAGALWQALRLFENPRPGDSSVCARSDGIETRRQRYGIRNKYKS